MKANTAGLGAICLCIAATANADRSTRLEKLGTVGVFNQLVGQPPAKKKPPQNSGSTQSENAKTGRPPAGAYPQQPRTRP